jgi:hypothetical protein
MKASRMISYVGAGMLGGLVGKMVMKPVSDQLYKWEPEKVRRQEDAVHPGQPSRLAAERLKKRLKADLSEGQVKGLARTLYYGSGAVYGPLYPILRKNAKLPPVAAGLITGAAMWLDIDEILTPSLELSAPNRSYPAITHARRLAAHLVYGLTVAATAEALFRLMERIPERLEKPEQEEIEKSLMAREESAVAAS